MPSSVSNVLSSIINFSKRKRFYTVPDRDCPETSYSHLHWRVSFGCDKILIYGQLIKLSRWLSRIYSGYFDFHGKICELMGKRFLPPIISMPHTRSEGIDIFRNTKRNSYKERDWRSTILCYYYDFCKYGG